MPKPRSVDYHADIDPGLRLISAMKEMLGRVGATPEEDYAIAALHGGRPAFWSTATYHNQSALTLRDDANMFGLEEALTERLKAQPRLSIAQHLVTLVPLNKAAIEEIDRYAARGGV